RGGRAGVWRSSDRSRERQRTIPRADVMAGADARRDSAFRGGAGVSDAQATVRCLTPPGSAAIAVLELSGGGIWKVIRDLFRPRSGEPLPDVPLPGLLLAGSLGPPPGDEVVLAVRAAEPVPVIEVHCHGGNEVVAWLTETIRAAGVAEAGLCEAGPCAPK